MVENRKCWNGIASLGARNDNARVSLRATKERGNPVTTENGGKTEARGEMLEARKTSPVEI